jgi:hypothetical protein
VHGVQLNWHEIHRDSTDPLVAIRLCVMEADGTLPTSRQLVTPTARRVVVALLATA